MRCADAGIRRRFSPTQHRMLLSINEKQRSMAGKAVLTTQMNFLKWLHTQCGHHGRPLDLLTFIAAEEDFVKIDDPKRNTQQAAATPEERPRFR